MSEPWCWICHRPLLIGTDGDGREVENCPPCRAEIEALQARIERLDPTIRPKCADCGKAPVARRGEVCPTCTESARRVAVRRAVRAEMERRKAEARASREASARSRAEAKARAASRFCVTCPATITRRPGQTGQLPRQCPRCQAADERATKAARPSRQTRLRVVEAYRRGHFHAVSVARRLGVSATRVYQILKAEGVQLRGAA